MAKAAKPAPAETEAAAKPKSKKLLLAIIGVLLLGALGGAGWYFTMGRKPAVAEPKAVVEEPPTFLVLDSFTVNLQHEESDQFLQIGITLKVSSNEMADKIRQRLPEVRSRLLFLLSSKRPSELMPIEGKQKLAREIVMATNSIIGVGAASKGEAASGVEAPAVPAEAAGTPAEAATTAHGKEAGKGVLDALFTAFVIQ